MNQRLMQAIKDLEGTVIQLQMEKAEHFLRFQNIEEEKEEVPAELMAESTARALQITKQDMRTEFDEVFRIHTSYTRKKKLPREVHMRFINKTIRAEIL